MMTFKRVAISLFSFAVGTGALGAGTSVLNLETTGTILATPVWQDANNTTITSISFSFDNIIAGPAAQDVDSAAATAKLVNATAYPASVALVRPQGCSIGTDAVANNDVHFLNNANPLATDQSFTIASNGDQSFALRFAAAGNYGDKAGAVTCSVPGALTYTY